MNGESEIVDKFRLRLAIELLLLFVAGPVAIYYAVYVRKVPLFAILPAILIGLLLFLIRQPDQTWRRDLVRRPLMKDVMSILGWFAVFGGILTIFTYFRYPDYFLTFPANAPKLWLLVMIFYPIFSVTTQELVYRVLYFDRYAPLFGNAAWLAILVNGTLFATMHTILFAYRSTPFHWEAVAISFVGGLMFGYRFWRTKAFPAVWLEHALYGDLIFTIGLGRFFFTGVANL